MSALAVRPDTVDDVLLSAPAIRAVAARADTITLLCGPQGAPAARLLPGVGRQPHTGRALGGSCTAKVIQPLRGQRLALLRDAHTARPVLLKQCICREQSLLGGALPGHHAQRPPPGLSAHAVPHPCHGSAPGCVGPVEAPQRPRTKGDGMRTDAPEARQQNPWLVLTVLCASFFMTLLDTTIVTIAIPEMAAGLGASLEDILWFANAYMLVFAALLLLSARLGDRFGAQRTFTAGLAVFTVASAVCGFVDTPGQMIAARVVQGLGAAVMMPQTLALISAVFPAERRGAAFGVWSAVAGLATVAGPTVGGALVSGLDWRWIFFINVPIGVAALVGALVVVPDVRTGQQTSLDLPGAVLSTAASA